SLAPLADQTESHMVHEGRIRIGLTVVTAQPEAEAFGDYERTRSQDPCQLLAVDDAVEEQNGGAVGALALAHAPRVPEGRTGSRPLDRMDAPGGNDAAVGIEDGIGQRRPPVADG